jgi:hypothetical protein
MNKPRSIEAELHILQHESFSYFIHEINLANGLILDKTAPHWPASIAATGLGLAAYPIAVECGFISHATAVKRTLTTLRFFWNSHQGTEANATGYRGFYYHFLDMQTGRRAWECELSTVDTAFLLAGMLAAAAYFTADTSDESEIRLLAEKLYGRADWQWAQNEGQTITHGWKPECGFLPYRWEGYDEALLLYILALGAPVYPLQQSSYDAWASTYEWKNCYGYDYLYSGSLFTHQLSHVWIDFRDIQDAFMRTKGIDYFENSRRATYIQRQYAIENPLKFEGYGEYCWGITASDGPGPEVLTVKGIQRQFFDYIARGVPFGPDDGTVAPWAAVTSLPFAPEIVLPVIDHAIYHLKLKEGNPYGFKGTFNQTYPKTLRTFHHPGWVSPWHYGINQGPIVLMIENYRSGLLWRLMKTCPYIVAGLRKAGFSGGWLETA